MKILIICNKSPYPPKEGGPIAMNAIINGLTDAGHNVKVLAVNSPKYNVDINKLPVDYRNKTNIEAVYVDLTVKPLEIFFNLFSNQSYHVKRFISKDFENKIIEILKNNTFDFIQLETLYMSPYLEIIRKYSDAKVILRAHNIEHLIWQRLARTCKNPLKRFVYKHLSTTLKNYELSVINKYDGIAAITKKDINFFKNNGCNVPIVDIPFGIDITDNTDKINTDFEFPSLFHIGSMNWIPNVEGIKWFIDEAWPKIHMQYPELKFYLAGREMPNWLKNLNSQNIVVLGEVDNASEFINSKAIMIVPLLSGSGIRIKIIEGMKLGKTIISTSIGAEGINYLNNKDILIADTADDFFNAVKRCVEDKKFCIEIGSNAKKLISNQYNSKKIIEKLVEFYKNL
ncbi:MAG: glycosyltransferase [Bacteroidales bacterium]|nr:glycosyltransferase [Bacteroidales bacterium]